MYLYLVIIFFNESQMTKAVHNLYIFSMSAVVVTVTVYLWVVGGEFYSLPLEERFYHSQYHWFKPSGLFGQGLGVVGTVLIAFGVWIYIARKQHGFMEKYLRIKYLLEFHIFLCTLGPILILFHTSFKFGGIVSMAFWSMVAIVASGVVGRFIYVQIPRNIAGGELDLNQIQNRRISFFSSLSGSNVFIKSDLQKLINLDMTSKKRWELANEFLKTSSATRGEKRKVLSVLKAERRLASKIANLELMKRLFKYWHVIHKPFAIIMLLIVIVHVIVTVTMGYRWVF